MAHVNFTEWTVHIMDTFELFDLGDALVETKGTLTGVQDSIDSQP